MTSQDDQQLALEEEFAQLRLDRSRFRRLLGYFAPHKRAIALVVALEALWVVSMLGDVFLLQQIVDGPLPAGSLEGVSLLAGILALNVLTRGLTTVWELRISTRVGVDVLDRLRREVFDHVQALSIRYFDRTKQGRIIARADRDVDTIEHLVFWGPIMLTMMGLSFALGTVYLFFVDSGLALALLLATPLVWLLSRVFHRFGFPAYRRIREAHSDISSHVAEGITGVRVIQAFGAEPREVGVLDRRQARYRQAVIRGARVAAAYVPSLGLVFHGVLVSILWFGGQAVMGGSLGLDAIVAFVLALGFVLGPIEGLGGLYNECLVAGAAAERIFLLLDTEPEVRDAPDAVDPGRLRGEIRFEKVSFSYEPSGKGGRQLHDVSFHVPAGRTVALVGHTGAGKTSIANLIARFYEAQEGAVRLDGHDVKHIRLEALHAQTGIVLQNSFLFGGSVLENLAFVRPGLSAAEARERFCALGCAEVLDRFPEGLETDVGERGENLSEGERQIVCFVRALLREPSLLILDEATSAVDTRTEALIHEALARLSSRQTTVVIAHRLSTIRHADLILVMEDGRIVEQGTHAELIARGGPYATLYGEYAA